jgi:hypothetical protein
MLARESVRRRKVLNDIKAGLRLRFDFHLVGYLAVVVRVVIEIYAGKLVPTMKILF